MIAALALALLVGCFLRVPHYVFAPAHPALNWLAPLHPTPKFQTFGIDEKLYRRYISAFIRRGLGVYPAIAKRYVEQQTRSPPRSCRRPGLLTSARLTPGISPVAPDR